MEAVVVVAVAGVAVVILVDALPSTIEAGVAALVVVLEAPVIINDGFDGNDSNRVLFMASFVWITLSPWGCYNYCC